MGYIETPAHFLLRWTSAELGVFKVWELVLLEYQGITIKIGHNYKKELKCAFVTLPLCLLFIDLFVFKDRVSYVAKAAIELLSLCLYLWVLDLERSPVNWLMYLFSSF